MKESTNEHDCNSASGKTSGLEASLSREGRHGVPYHRRVRHLHDFRGGLSLLHRKKSLRTDSARSSGNADLLHDLSAIKQPDSSLCGEASGTRQPPRLSRSVVTHNSFGRTFSLRHWPGVAPLDLRTRADHFDESFWNNVLLACWPARLSRYGWTDHAHHRAAIRAGRSRRTGAVRSHRRTLPVLAFC